MTKAKAKPPVLVLAGRKGARRAARGANPWVVMRGVLDRHGYNAVQQASSDRWTCLVAVSYGSSRAVFEVSTTTMFTGDVRYLEMSTTVVAPGAIDPPGYSHAVSLYFERGAEGAASCRAHISLVSKKPSHGVLTGTDALGMAVGLCRLFGAPSVELYDASRMSCGDAANTTLSLRRTRILSRGAGWYESRGFRSVIEVIDPGHYRRTVPRLHALPLQPLVDVLRAQDVVVRAALASTDGPGGRMQVARYDLVRREPTLACPPSLVDVIALAESVSVALEVLGPLRATNKVLRLGDVVDEMISTDCTLAAKLVSALLPSREHFVVLLKGADGRPVPQLPLLPAWVHTWRVVSVFADLTLKL
jgi:hypothetical protein